MGNVRGLGLGDLKGVVISAFQGPFKGIYRDFKGIGIGFRAFRVYLEVHG